jgi:hypothetical protein
MNPQRSSSRVGLKSEATRRLEPLMESGLVTSVTVEKASKSANAWITVGVSIQTKVLAKGYDEATCEDAIRQLKEALGDLPFRTVTRASAVR